MYYQQLIDGGSIPDLYQVYEPDIIPISSTSISVKISMVGVSGTPTSYIVKYQKVLDDKVTTDGPEQTQTSSTNNVVITGLTANARYKITTKLSNGSGDGNQMVVIYKLSSTISSPAKSGSPKSVGEKVTAKSFLTLKGGEKTDNKYVFAYRDFDSIQLGNYTEESYGAGASERTLRNYSVGYYSFGTSVIFEPLIKYMPQGAAIGFFLSSQADSGYFISLETSPTAAASGTSPIKIFKLKNKQIIKLKDSQKGNVATLDQLFAGTVYNVDVKVKIENKTVTITAYINGFKIEATDTSSTAQKNEIIYPSKKVALVGTSGTSKFDYVYADTIDASLYDRDYQSLNFYNGQFSKDFLDLSYGDMLYNASNEDVDMTLKENSFDEFGTVVREIAKRSVQFAGAPSIPIKWTTGGNRLAQIIAQSYDNFKADVLVLNNSSITVPLSDRGVNQLSIFGTDIGFSGVIEYSTSPSSEYASTEPVVFESTWLQNEKDVKSLADWILSRIVNKAKIVTMKVFGNPLISVGDIITISYSYQGFTSSQKIIVVKVSQRYKEGLETEVVGRTL